MKSVCGLDVHKDSVYLCILSEFGELIEKVFGVLTYQLEEMCDLMLHHHVVEVSMESTSVYWIPIWRVLSPHFKLNLANPYFIKQLPGRKSDVKDAQWIAECTMKELIRGSFVPPETIQQLRQYDRRIFDLNEEIVRKLSKLDAVLQRCNIRLSNYVSNVDSKSYKAVVRAISQGITAPEELVKLIHGRIINHHRGITRRQRRQTTPQHLRAITDRNDHRHRRRRHRNRRPWMSHVSVGQLPGEKTSLHRTGRPPQQLRPSLPPRRTEPQNPRWRSPHQSTRVD